MEQAVVHRPAHSKTEVATVYLAARKSQTLGILILSILMNNPFLIFLPKNAGLEILLQTTNTFYPRIVTILLFEEDI